MLHWRHAAEPDAATRRWNVDALHAERSDADRRRAGTDPKPRRDGGRARRRESTGGHQSDARRGARLGRDAGVPASHLVARPCGRRGDGYLAARDGLSVVVGERADQTLRGRGEDDPRRRHCLRRGHGRSAARTAGDARRRRGGVRGVVRLHRVRRRPHHSDGEPRACASGAHTRRLCESLFAHSGRDRQQGYPPLAR